MFPDEVNFMKLFKLNQRLNIGTLERYNKRLKVERCYPVMAKQCQNQATIVEEIVACLNFYLILTDPILNESLKSALV